MIPQAIIRTENGAPMSVDQFKLIQSDLLRRGYERFDEGHPLGCCPACGAGNVNLHSVGYMLGRDSLSYTLCSACWSVTPLIDIWGDDPVFAEQPTSAAPEQPEQPEQPTDQRARIMTDYDRARLLDRLSDQGFQAIARLVELARSGAPFSEIVKAAGAADRPEQPGAA